MHKRKLPIVALILLLASALYVGYRYSTDFRPPSVKTQVEKTNEVLKHDRDVLKGAPAGEAEVYQALVRLGQMQEPLAQQESIKRSTSPSAFVREGAANALGNFGDEISLKTLKQLLADPEKAVRLQAIHGLGHRPGAGREELLRSAEKQNGLGAEEKVAIQVSLVESATNPQTRETALEQLLKFSQADASIAAPAALQVMSLAPQDERVLKMLRDLLKKDLDSVVSSTAIRHLSALRDPWMVENLGKWATHSNAQLRMAAVQSVHIACPAARWQILETAITGERDRNILAEAINAPTYMPGKEAVTFLERMSHSDQLTKEELVILTQKLVQLKASNQADPCLQPTAH
ncbi:MAG: HEAT repeat domain-containing protein [Methylotenera sp.]|nr:HEAT repeat domain-containing protein [Oligoflexia bacterium]